MAPSKVWARTWTCAGRQKHVEGKKHYIIIFIIVVTTTEAVVVDVVAFVVVLILAQGLENEVVVAVVLVIVVLVLLVVEPPVISTRRLVGFLFDISTMKGHSYFILLGYASKQKFGILNLKQIQLDLQHLVV